LDGAGAHIAMKQLTVAVKMSDKYPLATGLSY
jgi:hypothetical protein